MRSSTHRKVRRGTQAGGVGTIIAIVIAVVLAMRHGGSTQGPPRTEPSTAADRPERSAPVSAAPKDPAATIRIGTWNIEWLGKPEKRSGLGAGVAQSAEDLADYILASRVDILGLQEIIATAGSPAEPRSRELDAVLAIVQKRTGAPWRYVLFPGRDPADQLTGVAWNSSSVEPAGPSKSGWRVPLKPGRGPQGSALWNRPPHAIQFSAGPGRTDFTLVVVHMKADFEGDFAEHRALEAGALADSRAQIQARFGDQDIVVLGDTNMTSPAERAKAALESAGLADLNAKSEVTHWRGGIMDRIFVPSDQPEFSSGRGGGPRTFEVMSDRYLDPKRWDPRDFKRRLSDHYLVVTSVTVMADDD